MKCDVCKPGPQDTSMKDAGSMTGVDDTYGVSKGQFGDGVVMGSIAGTCGSDGMEGA